MSAGDTSALDLDAIHARILAAPSCDCGRPSTQWCADSECGAESCDGHARQTGALGHEHRWTRYPVATEDAVALTAEVRRLRALHDAAAQAFDDLVALAWRAATGEDHEGPASVDDLIVTLTALRSSHRERSEALLTMTRRALDAERLLDATEGTEREEELARQIRATARREGAEAMREACAEEADAWADDIIGIGDDDAPRVAARLAAALRALPPPEGDDASPRVAAYRAGAEAMRDALVSALDAMVHAEATEAEIFRLTGNEDSAAEHRHKRAVLLEARVTVLGLPLPEVTS